jgi:hypothetical protein
MFFLQFLVKPLPFKSSFSAGITWLFDCPLFETKHSVYRKIDLCSSACGSVTRSSDWDYVFVLCPTEYMSVTFLRADGKQYIFPRLFKLIVELGFQLLTLYPDLLFRLLGVLYFHEPSSPKCNKQSSEHTTRYFIVSSFPVILLG